jgi:hypothetical protein
MRPTRLLVGLSVVAVSFLSGTVAFAATGLVDGSVTFAGSTCSWANATTSNTPPSSLTIDRTTVSLSCDGGLSASLSSNPTVNFNDAAGTATSPQIDVTGSQLGISCGYRVTNVTLNRQGTSRTYTGGPFTATKTSGSFLCPSSETVDSATLTFH